MQPSLNKNKLRVRKRSKGVKEREELFPCEDKNFNTNVSHNKTRKKTYLNLYILGKLWIELLSKALVGEKVDITSAKATQTREYLLNRNEIQPQLPKIKYQSSIIKYKDLPVYQDQNIVDYDKEAYEKKISTVNVTYLHSFLVPHVSFCRSTLQRTVSEVKSYVVNEFERRKDDVLKTREKIRENMRDPDMLPYKYTAAATGGITGYLLSASGGVSRRVIFTSLGLLSTGVVCFPNESGRIFKNVMYGATKACVYLYNTGTDEELQLCKDNSIEMKEINVPPPSPNAQIVKCPTVK